MNTDFLKRSKEKVLVGDGAMGTMIQGYGLGPDDFEGRDGCNEYLVISHPEIIKEIHSAYFEAGADLVETNSFGSSGLVLAEYGLEPRTYEIARKSAELAAQCRADYSTPAWPRFVAGSVGPGTRLPTLGHISFDQMLESYLPQMRGLLDGGVDLLQIETCQDVLQARCAVTAALDAMKLCGRRVPLLVTVTIETSGMLLIGTELQAAMIVLESLPVNYIGLNCATGPDMMQEHVRYLSQNCALPLAVFPNAGLPRNVEGRAVYDLTPEDLADYHEIFVRDFGVVIAGGCCGTTPAHIRELAQRVGDLEPAQRKNASASCVTSTYSAVTLDQDGSSPLMIGERCNANGSRQFREYLLADNWEGMVEMGREEHGQGAHVLDICVAYTGRNELRDMNELLSRFVSQVPAPLMIDSTQPEVIEAALKHLGGRSIINSINFEDGEEKLDRVCALAARHGAVLVALTIDEDGMARSADRKLEIARRITEHCLSRHGISADRLLIDPLTFTIASGDEDSRGAAAETLKALRLIKNNIPGVRTVLGLSNVSFGLKPALRQILNSMFLHEAIEHGLDACIAHSGKILPLNRIPAEQQRIALDLIYDRRSEARDPLFEFIASLDSIQGSSKEIEQVEVGSVSERLQKRIIDGRKQGIEQVLEEALREFEPLKIINEILLAGMKTVGDLFGAGEMQLPFVLQSAETMKKCVAWLNQYMDKSAGPARGSMVIATVRGDVHDIGKNLVDIILSNNGYKVINLGIKQPIENILAAVEEHRPDAVGMSGLLVKSTAVMKENLEAMSRRGVSVPVICGGAALNRAFVDNDLRTAYATGQVYYGVDAFSGLRLMDELTGHCAEKTLTSEADVRKPAGISSERAHAAAEKSSEYAESGIAAAERIPEPPFWGRRTAGLETINLAEVFTYINKKSLFSLQWMYRRGRRSTEDYRNFVHEHVEPVFSEWCQRILEQQLIRPAVVYGYFPCNSSRNEIVVFAPEDHDRELCRIELPRQTYDRRRCIADYFLPLSSGRRDVIAFHVVSAGREASEMAKKLFVEDRYLDYLHFYGITVETAEALAEYWHHRVRHELGIAAQDGLTMEALFRQSYQGARYSFGYPACPNLEDQRHIFALLRPEEIGVELSSEFQLTPEQSTSAVIVHHPEACYFGI